MMMQEAISNLEQSNILSWAYELLINFFGPQNW